MSFSSDVKNELIRKNTGSRHCMIAELAAIISLQGEPEESDDKKSLVVGTENTGVAKRYIKLIKELFGFEVRMEVEDGVRLGHSYSITLTVSGEERVSEITAALKLPDNRENGTEALVNPVVIQRDCCRRSFVRGAYLASGSMSDPEKSYHFEIVLDSDRAAKQMQEILNTFALDAKVVERKKHYVVYIKESERIIDVLGVMEAFNALMALENVRIVKDMRNNVNRQVNCETANINKTVAASVRQIEDIEYIRDTVGLSSLPTLLREIAQVRLENPEVSLAELGTLLNSPVGKSGVNHRLRKIAQIAEDMRKKI